MSLADAPSPNGITARIADAFAPDDARTMARLDWLVKVGGTCLGCGASVSDAGLSEHPGACGVCFKSKKVKPLVMPAHLAEPPATTETTMPCSTCGKDGHNVRSCSSPSKPAPQPAARPAPAAKVAELPSPPRARQTTLFTKATVEALVAARAEAVKAIANIDAELRSRREAIDRALASDHAA